MALRIPWRRNEHKDDPYWEMFMNRAPADTNNLVWPGMSKAPDGNVFV